MSSEKKSKPDQLFLIVLYQETVKTNCQSLDTGGKRDTDALFLNYTAGLKWLILKQISQIQY